MKRRNPSFGASVDVGQCLGRNLHHVARPFLETPHFAGRLRSGRPICQEISSAIVSLARDEGVDEPIDDGARSPSVVSRHCACAFFDAIQRAVALRRRCQRPLDVDAAVDGG